MHKQILVSAAGANYFPMLAEWVRCMRAFPQSAAWDIGIMDAGLTAPQVEWLAAQGCIVVAPDWPCPIPEKKIAGREYLKACVCRPFIPNYFPGYDMYFWMDPDTWLQRWDVVDMFVAGAQRRKIALTAQVDRAYPRPVRTKWFGPILLKVSSFYFSNAKKAYGLSMAKELLGHYVLSAGAFALRGDAPHWKAWQSRIEKTLKKGNVFTAEQLSLGIICHIEGLAYEGLPSWTHWLCQFKPMWDEDRRVFVEPSLPHEVLGILHLSGWDKMRLDRSVTTDFETLQGGVVEKSYRYADFNGEEAA